MKTFITLIEWGVGVIGAGMANITILAIIFAGVGRSVSRDELSTIQKFALENQLFFVALAMGVFIVAFVGQFIVKEFPWRHVVLASGIIGILYTIIFFSAVK